MCFLITTNFKVETKLLLEIRVAFPRNLVVKKYPALLLSAIIYLHTMMKSHSLFSGKTNIADDLIQRVKILCFIVIAEDQVIAKRSVYQQTWGRRCDRLLLFSTSATDPDTIILKVPKAGHPVEDDSYASLQALKYIYTHHLEEAHWFIRVHPMTFVVLENLRYFLKDEDYNKPIYFGQVLREGKAVFPLGSAGYVISRAAISKFGASSPPKTSCQGSTSSECLVVAECFRHLGIILGDSRDAMDRSRFHGISVESVSVHEYPAWFAELDVHHNMTKQVMSVIHGPCI